LIATKVLNASERPFCAYTIFSWYTGYMNKRGRVTTGFTIVELLIVIVIIGILAAITLVAYNGVQLRADNAARLSDMKYWEKTFLLYKAQTGSWPSSMAAGTTTCLGYGFPIGAGGVARCKNYWSTTDGPTESGSAAAMSQLATVSQLPTGKKTPINGAVTPIAYRGSSSDYLDITQVFSPLTTACPAGTTEEFNDPGIARWCRIRIPAS
jgi:prepilin-type N-terminal cleavage/methylation domain-containing protein